jgi:CBS domain-containing protein
MIYISNIIDNKVWDIYGKKIGKCPDLLISQNGHKFPIICAIKLELHDNTKLLIPIEKISSLFPSITLNTILDEIEPYRETGRDLWLGHQILDHQIVDVEGKRVVRVNDVQIAFVNNHFMVTGVDVGNLGLLRRLGWDNLVTGMSKLLKIPVQKKVISWDNVVYVEEKDPLRLNISQEKISKLPPADIASIMNGLDRNTSRTFLESMDDETLADTLEESPTKTQIEVLSNLDSERAADILEEMDPDEAADLLADLPEETSSELLELMNEDNAEHVRSLLDFPPDSAGGIMTTEFGWINTGLTIGEAISFLRSSKEAQEVEDMYYIYVLDDHKQLNGVVYLRDLVMASPEVQVDALMNADPVSVSPNAQQDEVAYLMAKYNLVSIPVVDEENGKMIGIVTLDDAIDYVLPTAYKKRLPRFF